MPKFSGIQAIDLRFPTSRLLDGSDAMNPDPDYSAAYVILKTDDASLPVGHGMTFTIGRGNELCVAAIESLGKLLIGRDLREFTEAPGQFWRDLTGDSQLRWLGPEKGVIHLATAALVNALWDLWAKIEKKPLWKLVTDFTPTQLVNCIDFRYLTDALTPAEAIERLERKVTGKAARVEQLLATGYPAYTTSAGWLGYSDEKLRQLCRSNLAQGWEVFKVKVGRNLEDDLRRLSIIREEIGPERRLMIDANQVWDVSTAIDWVRQLAKFEPWFIEEPTSPDDILGHAAIAKAVHPIAVATGEHCANRVMFKQFLQAGAIGVCQIDSCRLGGVNEVLAVMLLAEKFGIPVCPHAGGVGLCEYVQHLSMIDFIAISGSWENRFCEHAGHLHEHFIHPISMKNGRYQAPVAPGYSIEMLPETIAAYRFPEGAIWA
ncbi:L-fuconate dehydratase [Planctopirus hydrillae]|uniref:L-fuconate dehydratase n=1 Tax=Planctopirus hydrillae TaxID=1841610 RepID=A0A1C3E5W4_9PLAN|nr:L-fuconate dehydratase [Planctopirus hydrillae]ODA28539.1 fuconate dehydratase [Planctopirus hydrillae]